MTRTLAWIGLVVITGCSGPTELVVVTDSDLAVPGEVDAIVLHVVGPSGDQHTRRAPLTGPDALRLPLNAVLLHEGGALGPVTIGVLGQRDGADVVRRDVVAWFVAGRSVLVPVELATSCRLRSCPHGATCVDGDCVPVQPMLDAGTDEGADARTQNDDRNGNGRGHGRGRWRDDDGHGREDEHDDERGHDDGHDDEHGHDDEDGDE